MVRFFCDEMLTGLGRWLRIAGYDTRIVAAGTSDNELVKQVSESDRCFLTCDGELAKRLNSTHLILLDNSDIESSVKSLNKTLQMDWVSHAFQRCSICNSEIDNAPQNKIQELTIELEKDKPIYYCHNCNKLYWEGSHVKRMMKKLQEFQQLS